MAVGRSGTITKGFDDEDSCLKVVVDPVRMMSSRSSNVGNTYLCSHIHYYTNSKSDVRWGCGYRNLQMLLSSLLHDTRYADLLRQQWKTHFNIDPNEKNIAVPTILKLQEMIEWAWARGFDVNGRNQLQTVLNTKKWIGATEIVATLSSLRFRCRLVDVMKPSANGQHEKMFDWILEYFKKPETFKPPLYLQYQGHSQTIIGVEVLRSGVVLLLILDPKVGLTKMKKLLSSNDGSLLNLIRRSIHEMESKQYQIATVIGIVDSQNEYERNKVLENFVTVL